MWIHWLLEFSGENGIEFKNEILVLTELNYFYDYYPGKRSCAGIKTRINVPFNVHNTINNVRSTLLQSVRQTTSGFLLTYFLYFFYTHFSDYWFRTQTIWTKSFFCTLVRNTFKKYIFERPGIITVLKVTAS